MRTGFAKASHAIAVSTVNFTNLMADDPAA
jgi:hypothetical protein